jgi:hypothetical protein
LVARDDFRYWLSSIFKLNLKEVNWKSAPPLWH